MPQQDEKYNGQQKYGKEHKKCKENQMGTEKNGIPYKLEQVDHASRGKRGQCGSAAAHPALQKDQRQNGTAQPVCKKRQQEHSCHRSKAAPRMSRTHDMPDVRSVHPQQYSPETAQKCR